MTPHRWLVSVPNIKDSVWEGVAITHNGTLSLFKDGLTVASKVFGPGNWDKIERISDDPTRLTSEEVASIAARGLSAPAELSLDEVRSVCASVLSGGRASE